jgi:hypothetical protein
MSKGFEHENVMIIAILLHVRLPSPPQLLLPMLIAAIPLVGFAQSNTSTSTLTTANFLPQEKALNVRSNAFSYFQGAAALISRETVQRAAIMQMTGQANTTEARKLVQANLPALKLLEQGVQMGQVQAPIRWMVLSGDKTVSDEQSRYGQITTPATLLLLRLEQSLEAKRVPDAIKDLRTFLGFTRLLRAAHGTTDALWQAIAEQKKIFEEIEQIATLAKKDATTLKALANTLIEFSWKPEDAQEVMRSEFKLEVAALELITKFKQDPEWIANYFLHTFGGGQPDVMTFSAMVKAAKASKLDSNTTRAGLLEDAMDSSAKAVTCDFAAEFIQQNWNKQTAGSAQQANRLGVVLRAAGNAQRGLMVKFDCNTRAQQAMLTVKYALQAYELEKKALPEKLEMLVPTYLKQLPSNPFRGQAIKYDVKTRALSCPGQGNVALGFRFSEVNF